jgi:hypothetical protein
MLVAPFDYRRTGKHGLRRTLLICLLSKKGRRSTAPTHSRSPGGEMTIQPCVQGTPQAHRFPRHPAEMIICRTLATYKGRRRRREPGGDELLQKGMPAEEGEIAVIEFGTANTVKFTLNQK